MTTSKDGSKDAGGDDDDAEAADAASDGADQDPADQDPSADAPKGDFVMPPVTGTGSITKDDIYPYITVSGADKVADNAWLARKVSDPELVVKFRLGSTSGYYGTSEGGKYLTVTMQIPYLILEKDGTVTQTFDKAEWEAVPEDQQARLAVTPKWSNSEWTFYDSDGREIASDDQVGDGLTGIIHMQYLGNGDGRYADGKDNPQMSVHFIGKVPENAGADIKVGLTCTHMSDGKNTIDGNLDIPADENPLEFPAMPRLGTFINSNLTWKQEITLVDTPVLWDKYNYVVYKVTVTNTSEDADSDIERFDLNLEPEPDLAAPNKHLQQKDLAVWQRRADGGLDKVTDPETQTDNLVGVPGQGGVLIYDVTDANEKTLEELDTDRFSNAETLLGEPLPYLIPQAGSVYTEIKAPKGSLQGGGGENSSRSYYVAFPYSTNLQPMGGQQPSVLQKSIATVHFGTHGMYSWSIDSPNIRATFEEPKTGLAQQKRARDLNTNKLAENAEGLLGWEGSYVIDGLSTKEANIPVYGPESDGENKNATGPYVLDTIPEHYDLRSFDFQVEVDKARELPTRVVPEWFDTARGLVQIELDDGSWHSLNATPIDMGEVNEDGKTWNTYRIGLAADGSGTSVADLIAQVEKNTKHTWTRKVRFLLTDGLPAGKDLPARIKVNGVLAAPTKQGFTNTIVTHWGQRHWNVKTADGGENYTINPRESQPDTAVYSPVVEVKPTVTATGHTLLPGASTPTEGPSVQIPLTVGNSGWKFGLGNTSKSHMRPARFETSPLTFTEVDGNKMGFRVENVTLSAGLLANSSIKRVILHFEDGGTQQISGTDLGNYVDPAGTGDATLKRDDLWPKDLLTHITIDFDSVNGQLDPTQAWVDMSGVSTRVADYPVTGTLKTMYTGQFDTPEFQKSANASATLVTVKAVMDVSTHGQYVDVTEVSDNAVQANTDKTQTQIAVPYDRDFQLWAQLGNSGISPLDDADVTLALPLEWEQNIVQADGSKAEAWTGFHTTRLTLTKELLNTWDAFGEIRLYDADNMDKPAWALKPTTDGKAFEDANGTRYERADGGAGDLVIEEAAWFGAVDDLKAVKLAGWKGMATGATDPAQRVILDGFEDAALGKAHDLRARTVNYFSGVRPDTADDPLLTSAPAGGLSEVFAQLGMDAMTSAARVTYADTGEAWSASSNDATTVYVSKMAFDVSARAAYYDGAVGDAGVRFTKFSTPDDEGHYKYYGYSSGSYDEKNKTLEIGYKAIGSYLLDFRQYTNVGEALVDRAYDSEQDDIIDAGNEYGNLLSGKTYNTSAHLVLTQDLPEDGFDAYYLKIHPNALSYLERIEVQYSDGTTSTTTPDQWGSAEAVEQDANGTPFVRIGLLGKDGVDVSGGEAASRDAFTDYGDDDFKGGAYKNRTVDKIVYTLDINRAAYADDAHAQAGSVDFGAWYQPNDPAAASLEVTGRFFRDDKRDKAKTNAVTSAALAIGGDHTGAQRTGAKAQERFTDAKSTTGKSAWSYQDQSYEGSGKSKYDYKMGHIESTAKVDVSVDSHYVMKGVHDGPVIDYPSADGDENVAYGSDQHFSVSYYRKHVEYAHENFYYHKSKDYYYDGWYDRRAEDDWKDRVAFADHVTFADELPVIDENKTDPAMSDFYGFLTTAVQLVGQSADKDDVFIEHATKATFTTKKIKRSASGQKGLVDGRTIEVSGEELHQHREADGSIYINAAPEGQDDAPELKTATNAYDLKLERDEVLVSYEVELAELGGDADGSREIAQTYDAETSGTSADIDVRVFGRPYVYAGQTEKVKEDSLNTASVTSATSYAPETPLTSQDNGYYSTTGGDIKTESACDQAYFLGYLVTFDSEPDIRIGVSQNIYDYEADNNTPTNAPFEVRYKNRDDADAGAGRSARIDGATLHVDMDDPETDDPYQGMYRLRNLYIPEEFVGTDVGGAADWFQVNELTFKTGTNKMLTFTLKQLRDAGYLSNKPNADGMYVVDVEKMLREDFASGAPQGLVGTHRGLDATDTLNDVKGDNGWVDTAWDLTYAKPFVSDVSLRFEAVNPDIDKNDSVLTGGQWLSPGKGEDGVAFSFDGIYVDRTADDFKSATGQGDNWNAMSTPTFGKLYSQQGSGLEHVCRVDVENPSSIDPNSMEHPKKKQDFDKYLVHNLVAHPDVVVERGVEATQADGTPGRFFAYDRDDTSVTEPTTQDPKAGAANNIKNGDLMPGDYVEYTVRLNAEEPTGDQTAAGDHPMPLEYTQGRFTAPRGQRIVGWEEITNDTGQTVSAEFVEADDADGDGTPSERRAADAEQDYSLDEQGNESYALNRNLVFSIGTFDADDPGASQIPAGTGVTLRVITQMTDELQGDADAMKAYQDAANEPFVDDEPAFEDKQLTAAFVVTTMPKHGYVQARYQTDGHVDAYRGTMPDSMDHDVDTGSNHSYEDYRVTHAAESVSADLGGRLQAGMVTRSKTRFYEHPDDAGKQAISIKGEFTEQTPTGGIKQNDGSPAKLTVSGITNRTRHTQDVTVSVSFMSRVKGTKPNAETKDYQGFELTEAPNIPYPDGIPTNSQRKPVLVEYYDASADGGKGAWVEEDQLQEAALPTSTEEAAAVAARNSHEGPFGWLVDMFTPNEEDPIGPSEVVRASKSKFHAVQAVRWTYFDIPATSDGDAGYTLPDVELIGVGRFADTRPSTGDVELNDSFGAEHVDLGFTHRHNESGSVFSAPGTSDSIKHNERIVKYDEQARCDFKVWRRTPILTFQSQVFQDEAQASKAWDPQTPQKIGYVPGERFWYKETLWNMPAGTNSGAPNLEGELYNPAIYVKIPTKYLVNDDGSAYELTPGKVGLSWVDHEGHEVPGAQVAKVEQVSAVDGVETGSLPDYGGSMNYVSTVQDKMAGSYLDDTTAKGYFSDMKPEDAGVSNNTDFALYKITFTNAASANGSAVTMNVGDRIEVRYQVKAAIDGLPQVYLDADSDLGTSTDRSPAYFPRIGEYFAGKDHEPSQRINPLNSGTAGDGFGIAYSDGIFGDTAIKVNNGNVLMDMDALLHDAAFSGDKPEQSDRWESFDASLTYIPGSGVNKEDSSGDYLYGTSGNNGVYLDMDVKTGMFQQVRYTPRAAGADVPSRDKLPKDVWLITPNTTADNTGQTNQKRRDWDVFVANLRTRGDVTNEQTRWGHTAPLVWSQTSTHLQKAWLAAASDMQPDETDYKRARAYEPSEYALRAGDVEDVALDPHYAPWLHFGDHDNDNDVSEYVYDHKGTVLGKYAAALQYNQDFTAQLQALNYGDRNLDGVEMLYVMPRGVEPKLPDGTTPQVGDPLNIGATAEVLATSTGEMGTGSDPKVLETYTDASGALAVTVVQTPYSKFVGFYAPSDPQDPGYYREGGELKGRAEDLSLNPSRSSYEAQAGSADRSSTEYAESSQPWVLKVTVKAPLGKWFGRNIDGDVRNTADPDTYTGDAGYKVRVNIPAHVFANNESGTWNDRLLVTPWDDSDAADPSPASSYFSIMDVDHYEGANAKAGNMNDLQVFGMDYMFTHDDIGSVWELLASSPNMPSVNGYSVLNNSVHTVTGASGEALGDVGAVTDRTAVGYERAGKQGTLWAQTGTRAVMRKPFVRAWGTVGNDGVTGEREEYYLDADYDAAQLNVHVENRFWWDDYAATCETSNSGAKYEGARHGYATDGGQRGDLVLPVVTTVLPEHIAVVDESGNPYPTDGKRHPLTNWGLSTATAEDYKKQNNAIATSNEAAMARYTAEVSYEEVAQADGTSAKRYVVRFTAKDPEGGWNQPQGNVAAAPDANTESRIPSGVLDTFSFQISTTGAPTYDAAHPETSRSYENVRTYVTSKMPGYRFLCDEDVPNNPYTVGVPAQSKRVYDWSGHGVEGDARLDASIYTYETSSGSKKTYGVLPADTIDDGPDTVADRQNNRIPGYADRYRELGADGLTPNVEDYTFRSAPHLGDGVAKGLDADAATSDEDPFARRGSGLPDASADDGLLATAKLRASVPRLIADHAIEFNPDTDVPSTEENDADRAQGVHEAGHDQRIGRDGRVTSAKPGQDGTVAKSVPLQYGDTPWYRATLSNNDGGEPAYSGAVLHGKLVFAVHLPRQVSFYDKQQLTDDNFTESDAGRFYLEWKHTDRITGKTVTEKLTPQQLVDSGWYVHVREVPNWGANDFTQEDYAKPDTDAPNDAGADPTAKPRDHEGETLVFEFAAPNDATDEEFAKYDTLIAAMRSGVHAGGYFGSGDELTLRVKTRVDNVGADGLDDLTTDWLADESSFYATVHDLDGTDWPEGTEPGEDSWIRGFTHVGSSEVKPIYDKSSDNIFERPLAMQHIETFKLENQVSDAPAQTRLSWGWPLLAHSAEQDFDCDGDLTDIYTSAQSGSFTIDKPEATSRIDTKAHRVQVTNPDLGSGAADDAHMKDDQYILLDQAVNKGAAVNSFVVDWEVPYHGKGESSTEGPSLNDPLFNSRVQQISTGVWEIPGSSMEDGASADALAKAAYEQALRVYVLVRTEPIKGTDTIYDSVDYPQPGTSADRADYRDGSWRVVGSQTGYPVRSADGTKENTTIDLNDPATPGALKDNEGVKQIRWVIKAAHANDPRSGLDAVASDTGADALPVPTGFRLDVDAVPDDPKHKDETFGKQEADDLDPRRQNIGWEWAKDAQGNLLYDKEGDPQLVYESPMPDSFLNNGAFVRLGGSADKTFHLNHFIQTPLRYDDTKFMPSKRSRAGYYRDEESPQLGIDVDQFYFTGGPKAGYGWKNEVPSINVGISKMMKYRVTLHNFSTEELAELNKPELSGDTCTNPDLSIMVPLISALIPDDEHFVYVPYEQVKDNPGHVLNDKFRKEQTQNPDGTTKPATNIDKETPRWTYYAQGEGVENNKELPVLESTSVGTDSVRAREQLGTDLEHNRQFLSLHFTGPDDGTGESRGILRQGQELVFEFMMPIRDDAATVTSSNLLNTTGYVHKEGSFNAYLPDNSESYETTSFMLDTRDANLDGSTSHLVLAKNLTGLSFASVENSRDSKTATTQVDTLFTKDVHGAAAAPEGTDYTYSVRVSNLSSNVNTAPNYIRQVVYDVLPHEGDTEIKNLDNSTGERVARLSQWNGWLTDLGEDAAAGAGKQTGTSPAIRVYLNTPGDAGGEALLDPKDYTLWVGPFTKNGADIEPASVDDLPNLGQLDDKELPLWVQDHRANKNDVMHADHFVTLKELQEYVLAHPEREEELRKNVRAIWCQVNNDDVFLPAQGSLELRYDLHTPLNLPKFLGDTTKKAPSVDDKQQPIYQRLAETAQWNSFFEYFSQDGKNEVQVHTGELSQAGVMVDAPENRGYLGDYVWLDVDWSQKADDTASGAAAYEESKNGRKLLRGVRPDGTAFDNSAALRDLDGDGTPDDPGINGVRVELLNKYGLPVNRNGEAVKWMDGIGAHQQGLWVVCDPQTGEPIKDASDSYVVAEAGGPLSYVTESDYYGNPGYYMLSNLATTDDAGKALAYRLRFTFPEQYAGYTVTTTTTGKAADTDKGVDVACAREQGDDGVERLVATTGEIKPTPVAYDKDKFANGEDDPTHDAYDAKAVSHDIGIALPVRYEGTAWRDDLLADNLTVADPVDGRLDKQDTATEAEARVAGATVSVHEFDPATQEAGAVALDAYGKPATMTTGDDGRFGFTLKPGKRYVVMATVNKPLKPTPLLHETDPTIEADDNDLYTLHSKARTHEFTATAPVTAGGAPDYVTPGNPSSGYKPQDVLGLGYVDDGMGFIGNTVWNDLDQNGLQDADEPGIEGLEVTLETYWWNADADDGKGGKGAWEWLGAGSNQTMTTNVAGVYAFRVPTYLTHPDDANEPEAARRSVLAGYRVRIDRAALEALGYPTVVTRWNNGDDELDSDLKREPEVAADGALAHIMHQRDVGGRIVVAAPAGDATDESVKLDGPLGADKYDVSAGLAREDIDAGLALVATSAIGGVVWEDTDRDGLQDTAGDAPAEQGMADQQVRFEQWYLDGTTWKRNEQFGDAATPGELVAVTDATGTYRLEDLPTAYADAQGELHLAAYRLRLDALAPQHLLARYHASIPGSPEQDTSAIDSDARAADLRISDRDAFVAGKPLQGTRPNKGQVILAAKDADGSALVGATDPKTGTYNVLMADATLTDDAGAPYKRGGDVGQATTKDAAISGMLWQDLDDDGMRDAQDVWVDDDGDAQVDAGEMRAEAGVAGVDVRLVRYVADPAADEGWTLDANFENGAGYREVTTAADGSYAFDGLEVAQGNADGSMAAYGYRLMLADAAGVKDAWHIGRYRQGDDRAVDSDLLPSGELVDVDSGEVLVLMDKADDSTPDANRIEAPAALPADGSTVAYDVLAPREVAHRDGALLVRPEQDIAGYLWADTDHDGVREPGEAPLADKAVKLRSWILRDGAWEPYGVDRLVLTDDDGHYLFGDLPVSVREQGVELLCGYTLAVKGGTGADSVGGLPVTDVQVDSPALDGANSKVRRPAAMGEDFAIAWDEKDAAEEGRRTMDGKLVLAGVEHAGSHAEYHIGDFDVSAGASELRMHGGFGPFGTGSLAGVVWDDASYDGLQDLDEAGAEHGVAGVAVRVTQWYQAADGSFVQNEDFGSGADHAVEVTTDAEGRYVLDELPVYAQLRDGAPVAPGERGDDDFRLAAYRVSLPEMPGGYAATRFHVGNDPTIDSDLRRKDTGDLDIVETHGDGEDATEPVRGDGFAILAEPAAKGDRVEYEAVYNGVRYDAVRTRGEQRGGDAGLVAIDGTAAIEGVIFEDANADGMRADGETGVVGVRVALTRYMRPAVGAAGGDATGVTWFADAEFSCEPVVTGKDGWYRFADLPTSGYRTVDGMRMPVLYGYRVNVVEMPRGFAVTQADAGNDDARDSDLDAATTRLRPDAPVSGLTVLAERWEPDEDTAMRLTVDGLGSFTMARSHDEAGLDAGLVPQGTTRIAGFVWEDADRDGLQDAGEYLRVLQPLALDRRVLDDVELEQAGFGSTTTDGAPGSGLDDAGEPLVPATPGEPVLPEGGDTDSNRDLPRLETDGVWSPGTWTEVATGATGLDGRYAFEDLPVADEAGRLYVYRVRMAKPEGTEYVPVNAGVDDVHDNDYGHLNAPGVVTPQEVGVTDALPALELRTSGVDAWGRPWDVSAPKRYDREAGASVDLAVFVPDGGSDAPGDKPRVPGGLLGGLLPQTGDPGRLVRLLALAAGTVGMLCIAIVIRRRKREE